MSHSAIYKIPRCVLIISLLFGLTGTLLAAPNEILGEVHLKAKSGAAKDSGIWVDGQYLGYLKELKGTKKILLLPGTHEIVARQGGYREFAQKITIAPGEEQTVRVEMIRDLRVHYPKVTAQVKLEVYPIRAAVFVDGQLIGHAAEFQGAGKALLVAPGQRKITVSLPGYRTFETMVDLAPHQKFKLKTNLMWEGMAENATPQ